MTEIAKLTHKNSREEIACADILKLICAVLVVAIHVNPFNDVNWYLSHGLGNGISRIAVPFFFVASGYFCFRKTSFDTFDFKVAWKYSLRILTLYFIWVAIYSPMIVYKISTYDSGLIRGLLAAAKEIVFGYSHLWYMPATAFAVLVVAFALKKRISVGKILAAGFLLYIVGLLGDSYFGLLNGVPILKKLMQLILAFFGTTRNGLFEGVLFIGIGAFFAFSKPNLKNSIAAVGFVFSLAITLVETFAVDRFELARYHNIYLFLVPTAFFLFYLALNIKLPPFKHSEKMRTYSSLIYYIHMGVRFLMITVVEGMIIKDHKIHSLLRFAIVLAVSAALSAAIGKAEKHRGFGWLKKLH